MTFDMSKEINATVNVPKRPSYNDLFALVESLRQEIAGIKESSGSRSEHLEGALRQPVMDFRVLADLDKIVGIFEGRESTHVSADWLASLLRYCRFKLLAVCLPNSICTRQCAWGRS